ncbi:Fic family protein [Tunicatimonas pelagia]|uniref:Fic family protein n=1 Tax=Tunicatimonas pelagia TaxID=931531 RepID=UPI002665D59E|nr:Fic family protein [Tunicatimonas pelagia]WKN44717.1 Fic family protein [Tunicatimonas pelagia]
MSDQAWINPDRNQPWNTLPPLPIPKEHYRNVKVLEQLGEAKASLARLHGRSAAIPDQKLLINTISLQEAKASSQIENIFTTDDELYQAFSQNDLQETYGAPKEVLRYREALWKGFHSLEQKEVFDLDYFIQMYREVKEAKDGFRPAFTRIVIRQGGSGMNAGQVIYTPPRGEGILEEKLSNLLDFMNDDQQYALDPLLKMAIGHYQFEAIHPFRDGNGRTGRLFNIHYLTKKGLLDLPILFLSRYIIDHKDEYYYLLAGVSQRSNWQDWILYMLQAVQSTANLTYRKINDILQAKEGILQAVRQQTPIQRPEQMIEMLFTQPYSTVKHFTSENIYAENTARSYLNQLTELGVLDKRTIQGHHYYLNIDLYNILSE